MADTTTEWVLDMEVTVTERMGKTTHVRIARQGHVIVDGFIDQPADLAQHDAEVKAKALREAADEIQSWRDDDADPCSWTSRDYRDWLRSWADKSKED